ncbi:MAG TPA: hypothetical protein VD758_00195 [Gemmatimonadaceae bacterium]|nr:hypothetical protein [Gemmatimonadaceae bacterium]
MKIRFHILPALVLALACVDSSNRTSTSDSATSQRQTPVVTSVTVNHGTYGMSSKVRWLMSPDSSAMIAVVDPSGVENEAIPNAFFYGSESRNFQTRMDSVWDVAPSPDWGSIAFSRARVLMNGGEDSIPASMWQELSRKTGIDTTTLRTGSFGTSGMSSARGIAQPSVIQIPVDPRAAGAADAAAPKMYPVALGWHVRWTPDGATVALGNSPAKAEDSEESQTWAALDPKTGAFHGTLPADAKLVVPRWNSGPVLDISVPIDMQGAPPIRIKTGARSMSIETVNGVITAREVGTASDSTARTYTIGSGKAIAATKGGRYILALAPRARPVANEIPVEPVVYVVGW